MILYYTLTRYQQLASMLHKLLFAPDEEAHLYLSNGNYIESDYMERLKGSGIFAEVVILDDQPAWAMGAEVNFEHEEKLYPALDNVTELCFHSLIRPVEEYDDIYILADHFPLGFVLAYKNIPYHYIEEAAGVHCCYELWMQKLLEQNNKFLYLIGKKVGLYGSADCVIDCYVDLDKQDETYFNEKAIDFSIPKLLKEINQLQLELILKVFCVDANYSLEKDEKIALILTEYLAGAKVCSWEEQRMVYGMLIDYFCEDMKVFIKPHPNDHQGTYSVWFPSIIELNKSAPSELVPYCIGNKIDKLISLCSTSFMSLQDNAIDIYSFRNKDLRTEKMFLSFNRYYVASKMIATINDEYSIYGIGADIHQISYFLKTDGIDGIDIFEYDKADLPDDGNRRIIVIDDLSYSEQINEFDIYEMMDNSKDDDVFVFIDSKKDVLFFEDDDNSWAENIVPIRIDEISLREDMEEKKEWIFMLTKDRELRHIFIQTRIDRMLMNTGIQVKANDGETSIRERVLEGMLYATEQKCIMLTRRK